MIFLIIVCPLFALQSIIGRRGLMSNYDCVTNGNAGLTILNYICNSVVRVQPPSLIVVRVQQFHFQLLLHGF